MGLFTSSDSFTTSSVGALVGREAMVYQYKFTPSTSFVNVFVTVNKINSAGLPYIFLNVTSELNPTPMQVKSHVRERVDSAVNGLYNLQRFGFQYFNTSHLNEKVLVARDVPVFRGFESAASITIFNAQDMNLAFNVTITVEPSQGSVNWFFVSCICVLVTHDRLVWLAPLL